MKEDQAKLIVYRGWLERGKHVWSPFVIKLEARLRFAGVSYSTEVGSTMKAPNGKIPYVECRGLQASATPPGSMSFDDSGPPAYLGDSTLIIKHLIEWDFLPNINAKVSPVVQSQDLAFRALLEEKLYFYHVCAATLLYSLATTSHMCSEYYIGVRPDLGSISRPGNGGENTITKCDSISLQRYTTRCEYW